MLAHFITGPWGQGSGPIYGESVWWTGSAVAPLVPYHLTLVNWLPLSPRVTVQVRLLQHDLMYGTCLHVGFIWWHRARPRVTLLISSQVDKKKNPHSRQLGINHFYSFHIHTSPFCLLFHKRRSEWQRKVTFILCSYTIQPWNLNKKLWTPVFMQLSLSLYKF